MFTLEPDLWGVGEVEEGPTHNWIIIERGSGQCNLLEQEKSLLVSFFDIRTYLNKDLKRTSFSTLYCWVRLLGLHFIISQLYVSVSWIFEWNHMASRRYGLEKLLRVAVVLVCLPKWKWAGGGGWARGGWFGKGTNLVINFVVWKYQMNAEHNYDLGLSLFSSATRSACGAMAGWLVSWMRRDHTKLIKEVKRNEINNRHHFQFPFIGNQFVSLNCHPARETDELGSSVFRAALNAVWNREPRGWQLKRRPFLIYHFTGSTATNQSFLWERKCVL